MCVRHTFCFRVYFQQIIIYYGEACRMSFVWKPLLRIIVIFRAVKLRWWTISSWASKLSKTIIFLLIMKNGINLDPESKFYSHNFFLIFNVTIPNKPLLIKLFKIWAQIYLDCFIERQISTLKYTMFMEKWCTRQFCTHIINEY